MKFSLLLAVLLFVFLLLLSENNLFFCCGASSLSPPAALGTVNKVDVLSKKEEDRHHSDHYRRATSLTFTSSSTGSSCSCDASSVAMACSSVGLSRADLDAALGSNSINTFCPLLETVNLDSNQLTSVPASLVQNLKNLTTLTLNKNELTTLPSQLFNGVPRARTLDASDNSITVLPSNAFTSGVVNVYLTSNFLSNVTGVFDSNPRIKKISLDSNLFTSLPAGLFAPVRTTLAQIDLSSNSITTIPSKFASNMPALTDLDLSTNLLSEVSLDFSGTPLLANLDLSNNNISTVNDSMFANLNFTKLDLSHNQLTSVPSSIGYALSLYLQNNNIYRVPVSLSSGSLWTTVNALFFDDNPSVCVRGIDASLRQTRVLCDCAKGYYGHSFCESITDDIIVLPQLASQSLGIHLVHPKLKNGAADISLTTYPTQILIFQQVSFRLSDNYLFQTSIPTVRSPFATIGQAIDPTNLNEIEALQVQINSSLFEPFSNESYKAENNRYVPTEFTYSLLNAQNLPPGARFDASTSSFTESPMAPIVDGKYSVIATDTYTKETKVVANITLNVVDCGLYTCQNGGTCVDDNDPYNNQYDCICAHNYVGNDCSHFDNVAPEIHICPAYVLTLVAAGSNAVNISRADLETYDVADNFPGTLTYAFYVTQYNGTNDILANDLLVNPELPVGRHRISFIVTDEAGNNANCILYISVVPLANAYNDTKLYLGFQGSSLSIPLINVAFTRVDYLFDVEGSNLVSGLSLSSATGSIVGSPLAASNETMYTIQICDPTAVTIADQHSPTCQKLNVSIEVAPFSVSFSLNSVSSSRRNVNTAFFSPAVLNVSYLSPSFTVNITGGSGCLTYSVTSGFLPSGLSLGPSGAIVGVPSESGSNFTFQIYVVDSSGVGGYVNNGDYFSLSVEDCSDTFTCQNGGTCVDLVSHDGAYSCNCSGTHFTNNPADSNKCTSVLDEAQPVIAYCSRSLVLALDSSETSYTLTLNDLATYNITDNSGSFSTFFSIKSPAIYAGSLTLPATIGLGQYTIMLTASDLSGNEASCTFYLNIFRYAATPVEIQEKLAGALQGSLLDVSIFSLASLPVPLSIETVQSSFPLGTALASLGRLIGTPLSALPPSQVTVRLCDTRDTRSVCAEAVFNYQVAPFTVSMTSLPNSQDRRRNVIVPVFGGATLNVEYSNNGLNISAVGGSGCSTYKIANGSLPTGLVLDSDGNLSGTPTVSGAGFTFRILVTDASSVQTYVNDGEYFNITVNDCDDSETCVHGVCEDLVPYDGIFNCTCTDSGFTNDPTTNKCTLPVANSAGATSSKTAVSSSTLGAAIGGGLGGFILIVILIAYFAYKRAIAARPHNFDEMMKAMKAFMKDSEVHKPRELDRSWITIIEDIGRGNFGTVSKGLFEEKGKNQIKVPGFFVAVKVLRSKDSVAKTELLEEAVSMAQFSHPNVVSLIGVVTVGEPVLLVLEFMANGSLSTYLKTAQDITNDQRVQLCVEIASGLCYLASKGFIHRDVAARNVLLNSEGRAKISDFGLSRDASDSKNYYRSQGGNIPVRWCAPEALDEKVFSQATDVWAFGVTMFEIWTHGELPYSGWSNQKVWIEITNGFRLSCPEDCPVPMYALMRDCWQAQPDDRPDFATIVDILTKKIAPPSLRTFSKPLFPEIDFGGVQYADFGLKEDVSDNEDDTMMMKKSDASTNPYTRLPNVGNPNFNLYDERRPLARSQEQQQQDPSTSHLQADVLNEMYQTSKKSLKNKQPAPTYMPPPEFELPSASKTNSTSNLSSRELSDPLNLSSVINKSSNSSKSSIRLRGAQSYDFEPLVTVAPGQGQHHTIENPYVSDYTKRFSKEESEYLEPVPRHPTLWNDNNDVSKKSAPINASSPAPLEANLKNPDLATYLEISSMKSADSTKRSENNSLHNKNPKNKLNKKPGALGDNVEEAHALEMQNLQLSSSARDLHEEGERRSVSQFARKTDI